MKLLLRSTVPALALGVVAAFTRAPASTVPVPPEHGSALLVDLSRSGAELNAAHARVEIRTILTGLPGGIDSPLAIEVTRVNGEWRPGEAVLEKRHGLRHPVDASGLRFDGRNLRGTLTLQVLPDPNPKAPESARTGFPLSLTLNATSTRAPAAPAGGPDLREGRFWTIFPDTHDGARALRGTARVKAPGLANARVDLDGRISAPLRPGRWTSGTYDKGLRLRFDLGTARRNWNHARLSILELPGPRDLSAWDGLRVRVRTDRPRADVSLSVWLREQDGSWYYLKSALPLADPVNEAVLAFRDFAEAEWVAPSNHMDEDYALDLGSISHVAVGVVNPLGVGPVECTLEALECVMPPAPGPGVAMPAGLRVTGRLLEINGHRRVPAGIFGGYASELPQEFRPGSQRHLVGPGIPRELPEGRTEDFLIDCWFDRYSTAVLLQSPDWAERFKEWGARYAEAAKAGRTPAVLEFWNEPYLNWATRPGKNYAPGLFNTDLASHGGPVQVRYRVPRTENGREIRGAHDLVDGPVIPHFEWRWENDAWRVVDTTQFSYWSGRGNGWIYDQMLAALGPAVKAVNPEVRLVAGWGFRWHEDHWAAWDMLYRPTIDRNIGWIDGIHEHHYQGDTTAMNGAYEVLVAYAVSRHGKWLHAYNTETGDLVDAPARGAVDTPEKARAASDYRDVVYNIRDCIRSVAQSPDKLMSRTVIHAASKDRVQPWARVAYGFLRDLRGDLVETASGDPSVWCVASIDRPAGEPPRLVTAVFNDHREPRSIRLRVDPPRGTRFDGPGRVERTTVDPETFAVALVSETADPQGPLEIELPARGAWKIVAPLAGTVPAAPEVVRTQYFAPDMLAPVTRAQEFVTEVVFPEGRLAGAGRAWLRLVVEDVAEGEGIVRGPFGEIRIPPSPTADNGNRIVELPVDLDLLESRTPLRFSVLPGNHAGFRVDMASVVLESRRE